MAANTSIEWADDTVNVWWGCTKVAPGCAHCYAENMADRFGPEKIWGKAGSRLRIASAAETCRKFNRKAEKEGKPRIVFMNSMSDFFEEHEGHVVDRDGRRLCLSATGCVRPPQTNADYGPSSKWLTLSDLRREAFEIVDQCPWLRFLILTKRPENIRKMWTSEPDPDGRCHGEWSVTPEGVFKVRQNVWLGCSVSDQATADEAIPHLLKCRDLCPVLFLSVEPLLGAIDLSKWIGYNPLHEKQAQRGGGIRSSEGGMVRDSRQRVDLASSSKASEQVERKADDQEVTDASQDRRASGGGIPDSQNHGGPPTGDLSSTPPCLAPLSRSDPTGDASKSQEREEGGQSPGEFGVSNPRREHSTRSQDSQGRSSCKSARTEEPCGEADRSGDRGDTDGLQERSHDTEGIGGRVRSQSSSHIKDSSRREPPATSGSDCGLYAQSQQGHERTQPKGSIYLVIIGGESGPKARPCNIAWIRSLVEQCKDSRVPAFVKQLGGNVEWDGCQGGFGDGPSNMWPRDTVVEDTGRGTWRKYLANPKGGDPSEWPEDLRVREWPMLEGVQP